MSGRAWQGRLRSAEGGGAHIRACMDGVSIRWSEARSLQVFSPAAAVSSSRGDLVTERFP
jgi:hypothetical protein